MGSIDIDTLGYIFTHTGSDTGEMFKSLGIDLEKGGRDTSKLVQVERTVTSSKGASFTRKYWVKPDAVRDTDRVIGGQANLDGAKNGKGSTKKPEGAYGSSRIGELSDISLTTSRGIPLSLDSAAFKHNSGHKAAEKAVRECIQNSKATGHDLASALNRSKLGYRSWKVKSEDRARGVIKLSVEDGWGNVDILTVQLNQRNTEKDADGVKADTETLKHIKLGDKIWVNDNGKWSRGTKRTYSNAATGFEVNGRRLDIPQVAGMGWSKDKPGAGTQGGEPKDKHKGASKQPASTHPKGSSAQSFFDNHGKRDVAANKAAIQSLIKGGASRDSLIEMAEKNGVTWKKHDNPAINWMRASMAMTGATTRGSKSK